VTNKVRQRSPRARPTIPGILLIAATLLVAGCARSHYRRQADQEVGCVVTHATDDPRWQIDAFDVDPRPASRMYDPDSADCPPMPPDDPESQRLMHCVDGKQGWRYWHRNGDVSYVENPDWLRFLPRDEKGNVVLDRQAAMEVALLNSRNYQEQLEQLYLSAMAVTFERFRFDAQFFGGNGLSYTADGRVRGGGSWKSAWEQDNHLRMNKLFAGGSELMVGIANSLVWQVAGPDSYNANSLLSFSLMQPLLRAGGRAVVLERLTNSERALLANLRQMEQFRRGFYCDIVAGRSPGPGPSRNGPGIPSISGPVAFGGYLGLLEQQVRIRNQRSNIEGLRSGLDQVQALFVAARIDRLQLEQAKQAMLSAQSDLLANKTAYEARLDAYKMTLGLPPNVEIRIADSLLSRFDLIRPEMDDLQRALSDLLARLRATPEGLPNGTAAKIDELCQSILAQIEKVRQDVEQLDQAVPQRRKDLEALTALPEARDGSIDPRGYSTVEFDGRVAGVRKLHADTTPLLQETIRKLQRQRPSPPDASADAVSKEACDDLVDTLVVLSQQLLDLSLVQARARLEAISLPKIELTPEAALAVARENRPDWMNGRAALVDSWRQIEVSANALMSDLNLTFSGDIGTTDNNPVRFRDTTGRLRVGLEFDAPLTRLAERNAYRAAQIAYEQSRRNYYEFEDRIQQILRNELRDVRFNQVDFETQRATVTAAIEQVSITRESVTAPPKPGAPPGLGATTVNDLVRALNGLLQAQNSLLRAWISCDVQRMNLDFDMGTMQLDDRGLWLDPGSLDAGYLQSHAARASSAESSSGDSTPQPQAAPAASVVDTAALPGEAIADDSSTATVAASRDR
jgi:outer membrane protein TolC